jgi:carbon starvation protein
LGGGGGVALASHGGDFRKFRASRNPLGYWYHFVIVFEALFILTAVDTGTRVARYITQDALGKVWKPLGDNKNTGAVMLSALLVVVAWGWLVYNGTISSLWPMFGVANQLLAVVALAVGTTVLLKMGRVRYIWTTLLPLAFLAVTTTTAGIMNIVAPWGFLSEKFVARYGVVFSRINVGLSVLLLVCVGIILVTSVRKWIEILRAGGKEADVVLEGAAVVGAG